MISDKTLQLESHELNSKDKALLLTALEKMNDGVIILEAVKDELNKFIDFKYVYLNNAARVSLGIKKQDIENKTLIEYYPKLKNSDFFKKCLNVYENNITVENEYVSSPFPGKKAAGKKYYEYTIVKIEDSLMISFRNVTKGKEKEKILQLKNRTIQKANKDLESEKNHLKAELKESGINLEDLFRATFEQSAIGFKHITLDGKYVRVNRKFCEITGFSREELEEITYDMITYPEDIENEKKQMEMLINGLVNEISFDKRYIRKDGSLVWCNLTCSILENPNTGRLIVTAVKEISDRKAAEEQENAFRLRNGILLEISKKILDRILNYDLLLKYIVEKTSSVLGDCCILSRFQNGYSKPIAMYHPDKEITNALSYIFLTGEQPIGEDFVTRQIMDGGDIFIPQINSEELKKVIKAEHYKFLESYRMSSLMAVPLEAEGKVLGIMSLSRFNSDKPYSFDDLIFLKKIASRVSFAIVISKLYEELKISEERFRLALTDTPITVFNTDRDLCYTWIYDNMNIPDPARFIGKRAEDFLETDDAKRLKEMKMLVLESKRPVHFEECLKIKDSLRYYDMHLEALLDAEGNTVGLKGVSIDITQRKNIENKLNEALNALKQSNTELEQFAYIASHDLQEPLRMVSNFTQLLNRRLKDKLSDMDEQYMRFIVNGTQLMQNLISDLLRFSRITSQKTSFEETDMNEILASAINNLSISISEKNAEITRDFLPVIKADKIQMIQLLQNLISNALKFVQGKTPEVHIGCTRVSGSWKFSVKDNGIGISPDHFERIFLIFQRLHTREEYDGTGIGLAMCKKIVEHHGGSIWVESKEGEGAVFYFTIPQ